MTLGDALDALVACATRYKPIVDFLQPLATPIIGAMVAWVAYQQHQTNAQREKREARVRKVEIYTKVKIFLIDAVEQDAPSSDRLGELEAALAEADFVFPAELANWLTDLRKAARTYVMNASEARAIWRRAKPLAYDEFTGAPIWSPEDEDRADPHERRSRDAREKLQIYYEQLTDKFRPHFTA